MLLDVSAEFMQDTVYQVTHSCARTSERGEDEDPTWLEHTLEIKDDQNKRSQTGGKYHPAYPAHPHQFAQSLFHVGTERLLLGLWGRGTMKRRSVGSSGAPVVLMRIVCRSMS